MKKLIPLDPMTAARTGFTHKIIHDAVELAAWTSGTGQAVFPENSVGATSNTFAPGTTIGRVMTRVIEPFTSSGGAITTLTFSVGDSGSATRYINARDLKTAGYAVSGNVLYNYPTADTLRATATIAGQTMASLNGGKVETYLELIDGADLANVK